MQATEPGMSMCTATPVHTKHCHAAVVNLHTHAPAKRSDQTNPRKRTPAMVDRNGQGHYTANSTTYYTKHCREFRGFPGDIYFVAVLSFWLPLRRW